MFWRRKRPLQDFAEEIHSHIALEADRLRESAEPVADPMATARRAFGNVTSLKESFYERGRWLFWDNLARDLRHSFRLMRRTPGFSAVVIVTLAVGIGANTAIFSLIDAVLLRPLPYKEPGRLAMLWTDDPVHNQHEGRVSLLNFGDWQKQSRTFEDMTLFIGQTFLLGTDGSPERLRSARVPANFFPLLGVAPQLGRVFSTDEEKHGEHVAVLSHALWQRRFGGSARAIGSDLRMDGRVSRIIGVMPPQFQFPFVDTQVWEPLTTHPYWARNKIRPRSSGDWYVLGRVKPGLTWSRAEAEMNAIAHRLETEHPESKDAPAVRVVPLAIQTAGQFRLSLSVLFGSVFLILLIACINVANLFLARGTVREREFAVRRTLGAGRRRVAAQLLVESLVLSAAGGLLGIVLAMGGLRALIILGPQEIPRLAEARIDSLVLLFTVLISLLAAVISGLWPAVHTSTSPAKSRQWTTAANRNIRSLLVIGEFSLALVLLTGAGLLVHSFLRLRTVDPGFRPDHLLVMHIDLHVGKTKAQQLDYFRQAIEHVQALPGIRSAAAIGRFLKSYPPQPIAIEGRPPVRQGHEFEASDDVISGAYFETVGIPLRKGRFFSDQDRIDSPPVAIINETMAESYWPAEDPVGKRFSYPDPDSKSVQWLTIVGIAGDMHRQGLEKRVAPQVIRPLSQSPDNEMDLLVRTASDPLTVAGVVRSEVQSIDKSVAKFGVTTVEGQLADQTAERRFNTSLVGLFSLLALFLSAVGIYGLMHYFVVQRKHEIGVRMALGARYSSVLALVLRQGLVLAIIGIVIGMLCALGLTRMLSSLLYGVAPTDPVTFAASTTILLGVAILACWLPARRAVKIDPVVALRQD